MDYIKEIILVFVGLICTSIWKAIESIIRKRKSFIDKGRTAFVISLLFILVLYLFIEVIGPKYSKTTIESNIGLLINGNNWISYDPSGFNPITGKIPSKESIIKDLILLKRYGFTGVVTFNCNDYMLQVPEIAHKIGLKIIVGIWNPQNKMEIANAISTRRFADGFCVGNNGLQTVYNFDELKSAIDFIRFRTHKPISTTEAINYYIKEKRIIEMVDWIFPDAHISLNGKADAKADAQIIIEEAKVIDSINQENKPILLKMVIYPSGGYDNASIKEQELFFRTILGETKNVLSVFHKNISLSFYGVYDPKWKYFLPFYEWEPYSGLFFDDGTPKPALVTIMKYLKR